MITYDVVEQIATKLLEQYAGHVMPYYKKHTIAMICNTVMLARPSDKIVAEDMVRGMCHIFTYGEDNQLEKEQEHAYL